MLIIKGKILTRSSIYTDGWKSYDGLILNGYKHYRIHHHKNEFARGKNHVIGIANGTVCFIKIPKSFIVGAANLVQ